MHNNSQHFQSQHQTNIQIPIQQSIGPCCILPYTPHFIAFPMNQQFHSICIYLKQHKSHLSPRKAHHERQVRNEHHIMFHGPGHLGHQVQHLGCHLSLFLGGWYLWCQLPVFTGWKWLSTYENLSQFPKTTLIHQ